MQNFELLKPDKYMVVYPDTELRPRCQREGSNQPELYT